MSQREGDSRTQFAFLGEVLSRWTPEELEIKQYDRGNGNNIVTYWRDNTVIAQCLTRSSDNRMVEMIWPRYVPQ